MRVAASVLSLLLMPPVAAFEAELRYTGEVLANTSGGIAQGVRYLDNLDLELSLDTGAGAVFVRGLYNNGTAFSTDLVGDLQGVSNIEASRAWRLYEFWYEFEGDGWSLRGGLYDLNSEFDVNTAGSLFSHSSHGIGADIAQSGRNGPGIFPVTALAVRGAVSVGTGTVRMAVLDGVPGDPSDPTSNTVSLDSDDGVLAIVEYDRSVGSSYRFRGGFWSYSTAQERLAEPARRSRNAGWYIGAEATSTVADRSVSWFLRYGEARATLNAFASYTGAGFVVDAPFRGRQFDQLGLALASAAASDAYRRNAESLGTATRSRETALELSYRAAVGKRLTIQPDLQYIVNPSALAGIGDALVVGLRFELTY